MTPLPPQTTSLLRTTQTRRTIYALGKTCPVPDSTIQHLITESILHVPSSFNTQSTRLVLLLHDQHEKFWDLVIGIFKEELVRKGVVDETTWRERTGPKLGGVEKCPWNHPAHIIPFSEKFPIYKDHFLPWADHSNAMHQYFLWTALESLGFGANLQHYNPLIDERAAQEWAIPRDWRLVAQLVFGSPEGEAKEKMQKPVEERVRVYGARN